MKKENSIILFNQKKVRRHWDDNKEQWYFSIVDVVAILTESINPQAYWRKLKERLKKEGNETVTSCHALKMQAADGKMRFTDVADTEQLLRLIQSIPSPKAEPFKLWLAKVGYERIEETEDPELAFERAKRVDGYGIPVILPTSKAGDGAQTGYDLPVIRAIKEAVSADVVASGGAGKLEHFYEAVQAGATVLLAASMFHFGIIGIGELKDYVRVRGVTIR